jgi:diacylglycerol kinase (ATP)
VSGIVVVFNPKKIAEQRLARLFPDALLTKAEDLDQVQNLSDYQRCIVAGGDGTLRQVVQHLMQEHINITVGLIPVGTGNILARNLGISLDVEQAAKTALEGKPKQIDIGKAKIASEPPLFFTGIAGLGLDAKIMEKTDSKLKRRIGWVAYIEGGIRALPAKFQKFKITVDSAETRRVKVLTLIIANTGTLPGHVELIPDARVDDGNLDVAVIGPKWIWNWIDVLARITWQNRFIRPLVLGRKLMDATADLKSLEYLRGKKIRVESEMDCTLQLDGDPIKAVSKVSFEVIPKALLVAC